MKLIIIDEGKYDLYYNYLTIMIQKSLEALGLDKTKTSKTLFHSESAKLKGIPLPVGLVVNIS